MKNNGITEFIINHAELAPVSFHMPGHKGSEIYRKYGYGMFLQRIIDCDITEIAGADNLFRTEGIIKETADKYKKLYQTKKSYLLINGSSGGIIAAILSSVPKGRKLIMARNCHKSVFNALTLGNIEPVYAYPSIVEEYGIAGTVEADEIEALIRLNPDAEAVILPSPNYYGICSDIEAIAGIVHKYNKILIVDQAHGAHLKFFGIFAGATEMRGRQGMPLAAEECGADIVINSTHKTLASFTQSAVLNLNSDRLKAEELEDKLQAIESTSPSYVLMASLDINADIIAEHGRELFDNWRQNIEWFYNEARKIPGLKLMEIPGSMDITKINIDMSAYGIDGSTLSEILLAENIFAELATGNILMCMTGIGNTRADMQKLISALRGIASEHRAPAQRPCSEDHIACAADVDKAANAVDAKKAGQAASTDKAEQAASTDKAEQAASTDKAEQAASTDKAEHAADAALGTKKRPLHKLPEKRQLMDIELCEGKICAAAIIPYPPGIPLVCPGEEIGAEEIKYIKFLRNEGQKVIGINAENKIYVAV